MLVDVLEGLSFFDMLFHILQTPTTLTIVVTPSFPSHSSHSLLCCFPEELAQSQKIRSLEVQCSKSWFMNVVAQDCLIKGYLWTEKHKPWSCSAWSLCGKRFFWVTRRLNSQFLRWEGKKWGQGERRGWRDTKWLGGGGRQILCRLTVIHSSVCPQDAPALRNYPLLGQAAALAENNRSTPMQSCI